MAAAEGERFVIAVGSNIEPAVHLPAALEALRAEVEVEQVSAVYESEPQGAPGTPRFWNAALLIRSRLPAGRLKLDVLRRIEAELGRRRYEDRNAPRTIDLDLVLSPSGPIEDAEAELSLPDPELGRYAHLAVPVSEVVPGWVEPISGRPIDAVAEGLRSEVEPVEAPGWGVDGSRPNGES